MDPQLTPRQPRPRPPSPAPSRPIIIPTGQAEPGSFPRPTVPSLPPRDSIPPQAPTTLPLPQQSLSTPTTTPRQEPPAALMTKAAQHDRQRSLLKSVRGVASFLGFVATVVIAAMFINAFVFQSYYVDGTSMAPTLKNEDRLIIDKLGKTTAALQGQQYLPKRGDIVVLDSSILDQYGHQEQLIKRVIGLPGDTVTIKDGLVSVANAENPEGFDIDQQLGLDLGATHTDTLLEIKVPLNSVFVLGDNRKANGSFDSRSFGVVDSHNVQGRLALRIFPFNTTRTF